MSEPSVTNAVGMIPPTPANENARLAALRATELLDSAPEIRFDDITMLAARLCAVPISLISLVDEHRQWFKAKTGLDACETSREVSFCAHAICRPESIMEVPDAHEDDRFRNHPLVTSEPFLRFYAGVPLVTGPGIALGTLCVADRVPRRLTDHERDELLALARQTTALIELRLAHLRLRASFAEQQAMLDAAADVVFGLDAGGRVFFANAAVNELLGRGRDEVIGARLLDLVEEDCRELLEKTLKTVFEARVAHNVPVAFSTRAGDPVKLIGTLNSRAAADAGLTISAIFRVSPSDLMAAGGGVGFTTATCMCSWCKRVRNERNEWQAVDEYLDRCFGVPVSHGICEPCLEKAMRDIAPKKRPA
jgi:PAS domain S-box-containing protein